MANESGSDAPDRPTFPPFSAAEHLVLGLADDGIWHIAASASLELMRVHCFSRTLGGTLASAPWVQLYTVYADSEGTVSLPPPRPGDPEPNMCPACRRNALTFYARKLTHLLRVFGVPDGTRSDMVEVADALTDRGVG